MAKTDGPIAADSKSTSSIALQAASEDIWSQKYRLSSKDGTPIDQTVDDTWQRVARALADVEPAKQREHTRPNSEHARTKYNNSLAQHVACN